jgi:hypothetical protein
MFSCDAPAHQFNTRAKRHDTLRPEPTCGETQRKVQGKRRVLRVCIRLSSLFLSAVDVAATLTMTAIVSSFFRPFSAASAAAAVSSLLFSFASQKPL